MMKNTYSTMKNVRTGIKYNIIYQILLIVLPLITSPYLSRVLGAWNIGTYQYSYSIAYYFFLFAMLGVNSYGNREVAKCRESKEKRSHTFWQVYYLQLFSSLFLSGTYLVGIFGLVQDNRNIYMVQVIQILSACVDVNWYAFALEEFKITTYRSIVVKVLSAIAIFGFVKSRADLIPYALIMLGSNFIGLCFIMPLIFRTTFFEKPDIHAIFSHLKPNFVLFLPSIASSIYTYMDKIMLGFLAEESEVGYYNYAENIVSIPNAVTNAVCTVMLPRISNLMANNNERKAKQYLKNSILYVSVLNIGFCFGLIAVAGLFVPWYLGSDYMYTAQLVQILSITIIFNGISNILRTEWLLPNNKDCEYTISIVCGAVANVIFNTFMIAWRGAVGASIATIIAYLVICIIQMWYSKKVVTWRDIVKLIPFVAAGFIMYFLLQMFNRKIDVSDLVKILLDIALGGTVYLALSGLCIFSSKKLKRDKFE